MDRKRAIKLATKLLKKGYDEIKINDQLALLIEPSEKVQEDYDLTISFSVIYKDGIQDLLTFSKRNKLSMFIEHDEIIFQEED